MTLLIALEFNHTLRYVVTHDRGIVQAKIVILIALLAVVRKVIVVDLYDATPASVAARAGLVLSLCVTYWLMLERGDRMREPLTTKRRTGGQSPPGWAPGRGRESLHLGRNQSDANGIAHQRYHVMHPQALHHLSPMRLHRLGAELQAPSG